MPSLRRKLMTGLAVGTTLIFASAAASIFLLARASLLSEFDAATLVKARTLSGMVEYDKGTWRIDEEDLSTLPEFGKSQHEYFQVWSLDNQVQIKSASLGDAELKRNDAVKVESLILPGGGHGRQSYLAFHPRVEQGAQATPVPEAILAVARDISGLEHHLARLRWLLVLVCGVATLVMLVMTGLVIRQSLSPINRLAADISAIGARNLSDRISTRSVPAELSPIVLRLNDLLGRLDAAFEREKSFTADAAHELRTPLAGLESALEVCARKDRAPEAYATVVRECLDVVRGMHGMIDNLLLLARADAQQIKPALAKVRLDEILEESWRRFGKQADARSLRVDWSIEPGLVLETDRDKLLHVLNNLFDNAVRYAEVGGRIAIEAAAQDTHAVLRISNTGSKLSEEEASHVFDRFWRHDPARSEIGFNCGLGLSVCQKMIGLLGGAISARSEAGGEFAVEITLPGAKVHVDFMVAK